LRFLSTSRRTFAPLGKEVRESKLARIKYNCPDCWIKVWGKPGFSISCDDCQAALYPVAQGD
jgi:ribosomal protein S27E